MTLPELLKIPVGWVREIATFLLNRGTGRITLDIHTGTVKSVEIIQRKRLDK